MTRHGSPKTRDDSMTVKTRLSLISFGLKYSILVVAFMWIIVQEGQATPGLEKVLLLVEISVAVDRSAAACEGFRICFPRGEAVHPRAVRIGATRGGIANVMLNNKQ